MAARAAAPTAVWRACWRITGIAGALLACLPGHYMYALLGLASPWPRIYLRWVGRIAGLRVEQAGTPLRAHVLLLANHVSWLDIMLLAGTTGCSFVSKKEVAHWPVAGWLARLNRTIFIARTQRGAVLGQADTLRAALASGRPVALFPEGTTEGGMDVLPFRASLLAAVFPPLDDLKVQPVAIDYHAIAHDIAWLNGERAAANAMRVLGRRGRIPVTLHFLEPINPAETAGRKELAAATRSEIIDALKKGLSGSPTEGDRL